MIINKLLIGCDKVGKVNVSVQINEKENIKLKRIAFEMDLPKSEVIKLAIKELIDKNKKK